MKIIKDVGSQCENKHQYKSKVQAQNIIDKQMHSMESKIARLNAYKCRYCGYWHIGNKPKEITTGSVLRKHERQQYEDKMLNKYPQKMLIN